MYLAQKLQISEDLSPHCWLCFSIWNQKKVCCYPNLAVRITRHVFGIKNYYWKHFISWQKSDGFKPVFISHLGAQSTPTGAPMSICSVDKKSNPVDTRPQTSAKCNFKVGHVNERERSTTMGSQICCGAVAGEDTGGRAALMRDGTWKNQSRSLFLFHTDWHQASPLQHHMLRCESVLESKDGTLYGSK